MKKWFKEYLTRCIIKTWSALYCLFVLVSIYAHKYSFEPVHYHFMLTASIALITFKPLLLRES